MSTVNGDTNAPYVDAGPFTLDPGQSQTVIVRVSQMTKGATRGFIVATGSKSNVSTRIPYWFGVPGTDVKQVAVLSEVDYTNQSAGDLMTFYFRMIDGVGLPVDGGPTVTTASPGARVISVNPAGRIPGTFQAQVRIGKADSKGVNTFTISAGQVRRDVVVGVQ